MVEQPLLNENRFDVLSSQDHDEEATATGPVPTDDEMSTGGLAAEPTATHGNTLTRDIDCDKDSGKTESPRSPSPRAKRRRTSTSGKAGKGHSTKTAQIRKGLQADTSVAQRSLGLVADHVVYDDAPIPTWSLKSEAPSNLNVAFWNANGRPHAHEFATAELVEIFLGLQTDVLCVNDARVTSDSRRKFLTTQIMDAIPGAKVSITLATYSNSQSKGGSNACVGGTLTIISPRWSSFHTNTKVDGTNLGLLACHQFVRGSVKFQVISTYLPNRVEKGENSAASSAWTRLKKFIQTSPQKGLSPLDFLLQHLARWITEGEHHGYYTMLGGDLNGKMDLLQRHARDLRQWASQYYLLPVLSALLLPGCPAYYTRTDGRSHSRIDHILVRELPENWAIVGCGVENHMAAALKSDQRPIWTRFKIDASFDRQPSPKHVGTPARTELNVDKSDDVKVYQEEMLAYIANTPLPLETDSSDDPELLGKFLSRLLLASVTTVALNEGGKVADLHGKCKRRRSRYKDGYSLQMRALEDAMHLYQRILKLAFTGPRKLVRKWTKDRFTAILNVPLSKWRVRMQRMYELGLERDIFDKDRDLDPSHIHALSFHEITHHGLKEKIDTLKGNLHGAQRTMMRQRMDAIVAFLEDKRQAGKIGFLIKCLGAKEFKVLDLSFLPQPGEGIITAPQRVHGVIVQEFQNWYAEPEGLNPAACRLADREDDSLWRQLLDDEVDLHTPFGEDSGIPADLQQGLADTFKMKASREARQDIEEDLAQAVSFAEWNAAINSLKSGKAPAPLELPLT